MVLASDVLSLSETWIRILNRMETQERRPRDFGSGDLLHCSEIHTIMAIGKNPGINVTSLSHLLGISKSAISQMITRLTRKELVERFRDEQNGKEILLHLSPRGQIAFLGHEQHHARIYALMHRNLGDLTDEQFSIIIRFLKAMEATIEEGEE